MEIKNLTGISGTDEGDDTYCILQVSKVFSAREIIRRGDPPTV